MFWKFKFDNFDININLKIFYWKSENNVHKITLNKLLNEQIKFEKYVRIKDFQNF